MLTRLVSLILIIGLFVLPAVAADMLQGQATAMLVSADGYLLAGSAPLKGAGKIVATIAGKAYDAKIVKTDEKLALTLLKVNGTNLPALSVAGDDAIARGGNGRLAGYPTAPFRGQHLKSMQSWFNIGEQKDQPKALMLYIQPMPDGDDSPVIDSHGNLAGIMRSDYWTKRSYYGTTAMPISVAKTLFTDAGVKLVDAKTGTGNKPLDDATFQQQVSPGIVLLTLYASPNSPQRVNTKDNAVLVSVPAGEFLMGTPNGERPAEAHEQYMGSFTNESPQHKVTLDSYWIYKYPVTVEQYRTFCKETNRPMPPLPRWAHGDVPMANVTWQDAADYAQWAGATLPTEAQYEKAARGTDGRNFPWGEMQRWSDPRYISSDRGGGAQPVGCMAKGASPYGALDMVGNVWEWCADWYLGDYYKQSPARNPLGPATGTEKTIRGGSWFDYNTEDFRCATRNHLLPEQHNYFTGFRCVIVNPQ